MKRLTLSILFGWLLILASALQAKEPQPDPVYQVSTIDALLQGVYDGEISCQTLTSHGDLGIGTFNGLEGEMVVLDGTVYQVKVDGTVHEMAPETTTPFACVADFDEEKAFTLKEADNYEALKKSLDQKRSSDNLFYAVRLEGEFDYVKTRSVPRQEKPYPPLVEVVKTQQVFEMEKVKGVIVGFWCPSYVKGVNVPLYHLHFLSEDRSQGGHLLDCRFFQPLEGALDTLNGLNLILPEGEAFHQADLKKDQSEALEKVEQDSH